MSSGEGSLSLARAFLAAGVPVVIASLWPVDDRETARLFSRFYRNLRDGGEVLDALRQAQLETLNLERDRPGSAWAAFELIGGMPLEVS